MTTANAIAKQVNRAIARDDGPVRGCPLHLVLAEKIRSDASSNMPVSPADIVRGMDRQEFVLEYQPQFDIVDCAQPLSGVEALVRWNHPRLGFLSPGQFMHAIQSAGLEFELGTCVLGMAIDQIKTWLNSTGWSPRVSVNMAAEHLDSENLSKNVMRALHASQIGANYLEIEILESAVIRHMDRAARELQSLREMGVRVAIDDFGMGTASFHSLLQLPCDTIKLCAEFVQGIGHGTGADEICKAVIHLGSSLSKHVVAEGVETRAQLEFLRQHGCHEVQGYLLGRPVIGDVFSRLFMKCKSRYISQA
ncbi:MAG: EAL domain-containing protein [Luteimonas sp.]